jgi:hypothetical protein
MMKTGVAVLFGTPCFAWKPLRLEDNRVAWLRYVHRVSPVCGLVPLYHGRPVKFTDRIPFCSPSLSRRISTAMIWSQRSMKVLIARMVIGWLVLVEAITFGLGVFFGHHPALGGFNVGLPMPVYLPGQFLLWYDDLHPADVWVLTYAVYLCLLLLLVVAGVGAMKFQAMSQRGDASRITSSRQARGRLR